MSSTTLPPLMSRALRKRHHGLANLGASGSVPLVLVIVKNNLTVKGSSHWSAVSEILITRTPVGEQSFPPLGQKLTERRFVT